MYLRRVITVDAFVYRRGELHPMSYVRVDPEEHLASAAAADMV